MRRRHRPVASSNDATAPFFRATLDSGAVVRENRLRAWRVGSGRVTLPGHGLLCGLQRTFPIGLDQPDARTPVQ